MSSSRESWGMQKKSKVRVSIGILYYLQMSYLSGEILGDSGQEGLGEVEAWNPEAGRGAVVDPSLHELESFQEIQDPGSHGLETGVGDLLPEFRHPVVVDCVEQGLEVVGHGDYAVDGFLQVAQGAGDSHDHPIVPDEFLLQNLRLS